MYAEQIYILAVGGAELIAALCVATTVLLHVVEKHQSNKRQAAEAEEDYLASVAEANAKGKRPKRRPPTKKSWPFEPSKRLKFMYWTTAGAVVLFMLVFTGMNG